MITIELFNRNWVALNVEASSEDELFEIVGKKAHDLFLAYPDYGEGLKKREAEYPTGLNIGGFKVALPHVDPEYIKQPFVFLVTTNKPLKVKEMATEEPLETSAFFFLGIKDGHNQVGLLSGILNALQDETVINEYQDAVRSKDSERLVNVMQDSLKI